jgi:hypothetical protein
MNKFLHDPSRYSHYRPLYPKKIFEYLSSISYEKNLAIDCGAGSGPVCVSDFETKFDVN